MFEQEVMMLREISFSSLLGLEGLMKTLQLSEFNIFRLALL